MGLFDKKIVAPKTFDEPDEPPGCSECRFPFCASCGGLTCSCSKGGCRCLRLEYRKMTARIDRYSDGPTPRLARVREKIANEIASVGEVKDVMPLRLHDHKGELTVWWPHVGGLRFKTNVRAAWDDEFEDGSQVVHRLGLEGKWVFGDDHDRPDAQSEWVGVIE